MSSPIQEARFVSAHGRALVVTFLLLATAFLDVIALIVHLLRLLDAGPFSDGASDVSSLEGTPDLGALFVALVTLAHALVFIATAVLFLVWIHRAYKNLRAFARRTDFKPGWAVGWWFVPFANLVQPYNVVKEMWTKSDPMVDFSNGYANAGEGARATFPIGVWWLFWIVWNVAEQAYSRISDGGTVVSGAANGAGIAAHAFSLIAALLAAFVVWTIDRMQTEKSQRLGLNLWAAPPPPPASFDPPPYGAGV